MILQEVGEINGGRPVCKALKVKVASLNRMRHSIGNQKSCLRSSSEDSNLCITGLYYCKSVHHFVAAITSFMWPASLRATLFVE